MQELVKKEQDVQKLLHNLQAQSVAHALEKTDQFNELLDELEAKSAKQALDIIVEEFDTLNEAIEVSGKRVRSIYQLIADALGSATIHKELAQIPEHKPEKILRPGNIKRLNQITQREIVMLKPGLFDYALLNQPDKIQDIEVIHSTSKKKQYASMNVYEAIFPNIPIRLSDTSGLQLIKQLEKENQTKI